MNTFLIVLVFLSLANSISVFADINEDDIFYVFYSRTYMDGINVTNREETNVTHIRDVFDSNHSTIYLVHGFNADYTAECNIMFLQAVLSKEDANIIAIDWSKYAKSYIKGLYYLPELGKIIANFTHDVMSELNYSLDDITIIGVSLGAHLAGTIGKYTNGIIGSIVGLDPSGLLIDPMNTDYCVDASDAQYVQIIHTDVGVAGMSAVKGDADFYPNGGTQQPGCESIGCGHTRSWLYYNESLIDNKFVSQQCDNYYDFISEKCHGTKALMGGWPVDRKAIGKYYLITNGESPYGRG